MRELSFGARISDSFLKKLKWETAKATDESPDVLPCLCEEERQRHQSFDCNEGQSKRIDIVMVALSREEAGTDRPEQDGAANGSQPIRSETIERHRRLAPVADLCVNPMLCESCHQRDAVVHLTTTACAEGRGQEPGTPREQHFCEQCADTYFACTPGMNSARHLICLSDSFRTRLYDLLEMTHPEAFDNSTTEACRRGSELMRSFLREHLTKDKIELNEDAFEMLAGDFFGSHHFYTRVDEYKRKKG